MPSDDNEFRSKIYCIILWVVFMVIIKVVHRHMNKWKNWWGNKSKLQSASRGRLGCPRYGQCLPRTHCFQKSVIRKVTRIGSKSFFYPIKSSFDWHVDRCPFDFAPTPAWVTADLSMIASCAERPPVSSQITPGHLFLRSIHKRVARSAELTI